MRNAENKDKENQLTNLLGNANLTPENLNNALNQVSGNNTQINEDAREIAHHLGTVYPWYDPRSFTENDLDAYNVLKKYNPVPLQLHNAYMVVTVGGSLRNDVNRLLDTKYRNLIKWA